MESRELLDNQCGLVDCATDELIDRPCGGGQIVHQEHELGAVVGDLGVQRGGRKRHRGKPRCQLLIEEDLGAVVAGLLSEGAAGLIARGELADDRPGPGTRRVVFEREAVRIGQLPRAAVPGSPTSRPRPRRERLIGEVPMSATPR